MGHEEILTKRQAIVLTIMSGIGLVLCFVILI